MRTSFGKRSTAAAILLVALVGAACSGSDGDQGAAAGIDTAGRANEDGPVSRGLASSSDALGDTSTQFSTGGGGDGGAPDAYLVSAAPERVIKTADLRLEVEDGELARTMREGRTIAESAGGFVLSTSVDGSDRRRGEFVIRVPAADFEESLSALEELGTVAGETVRGEDVSQEFVDLEARLRNATAQEEVLFRLYDRSNSIADTIRVQRELEDVQLEIERLRGRLRFLSDQTDLSTISVSVAEDGAVVADAGPFEKAWDTARKTFVAVVSGAIVGAGFLLPLVAFALLAYLVFRLVRPRLQRAAS
jgi:hypothetical protein